MLAPYACDPAASRGRLHPQPPSPTRLPHERDRDRIVHSTAFRRLRGKTQVFVAAEGDHYRVRLTHSLEVAQIARTIARALNLNEALTEALALAHDLGHPPFGHAGEEALAAGLAQHGGWDHNAHTLRVVSRLETPYPGFDGLNLTWETLEGLAKHNGPVTAPPWALAEADHAFPLELATHASLEAQVAALADDIAYDCHDLDDGFRAGLITLDHVAASPFLADCWATVTARFPATADTRRWGELVREALGRFAADLIAETTRRTAEAAPANVHAVRTADRPLAAFSPPVASAERALKALLYAHMYKDPRVTRVTEAAAALLTALFEAFARDPDRLPPDWRASLPAKGPQFPVAPDAAPPIRRNFGDSHTIFLRHVADYVAGMTDRHAIRAYIAHVGPSPLPPDLF